MTRSSSLVGSISKLSLCLAATINLITPSAAHAAKMTPQQFIGAVCSGTTDLSALDTLIANLKGLYNAVGSINGEFQAFDNEVFSAGIEAGGCVDAGVDVPEFDACANLNVQIPGLDACMKACGAAMVTTSNIQNFINNSCIKFDPNAMFSIPRNISACAGVSGLTAGLQISLPRIDTSMLASLSAAIDALSNLKLKIDGLRAYCGVPAASLGSGPLGQIQGALDGICSFDINIPGAQFGLGLKGLAAISELIDGLQQEVDLVNGALAALEQEWSALTASINACIGAEIPSIKLPSFQGCLGNFQASMSGCFQGCASGYLGRYGALFSGVQGLFNTCASAHFDSSIPLGFSACGVASVQGMIDVPIPTIDLSAVGSLMAQINLFSNLSLQVCGVGFSATPRIKLPADYDGDGISNATEIQMRSNPMKGDTDRDGVIDGVEKTAGTDPLDRGSVKEVVGTSVCAEWNGFLGGMYNIMEHVNLSTHPINFSTTIFSIDGTQKDTKTFSVAPGAQIDVLVHDFKGWTRNSYGKVCSTHNGAAGELDGRMVYYRPAPGGGFEFAFAMPFAGGRTGPQFVGYNTYQPSLASGDQNNLVTNWIQLTNIEKTPASGSMIAFNPEGTVLKVDRINLPAGARIDIAAHAYGKNQYGVLEWLPDDPNKKFQVRNVRYLYATSNPGIEQFSTAFQLEAQSGNGRTISAPIDTRKATAVLEISNTAPFANNIGVAVYSSSGALKMQTTLALKPHATQHLIVDQSLNQDIGIAKVTSSVSGGASLTVMQYGRTANGGIKYMYGIPASEAMGTTLQSSYNTYLQQNCSAYLVNPTSTVQTASLTVTRSNGTKMLSNKQVSVPANGLLEYNLCQHDSANNYGVAVFTATKTNTILGYVVRQGDEDDYRFPTPLR